MKEFLKIFGIFFLGLLTAIIIYPTLHEGGHLLAAFTVGAKVVDVGLFPTSYVMCETLSINRLGFAAIGLGGISLPYLLSVLLKPKVFWVWYINFILRCISILAILISYVNVFLWSKGMPLQNEDVAQVLKKSESFAIPLLIIFSVMLACGVMQIVFDRPARKICAYFNV